MLSVLLPMVAVAVLGIAALIAGPELLAEIDGDAPSTPEAAAQPAPRDFANHGCE